jgi:dipeptidase
MAISPCSSDFNLHCGGTMNAKVPDDATWVAPSGTLVRGAEPQTRSTMRSRSFVSHVSRMKMMDRTDRPIR